ncbi:glycine cleavage system protein GcvH [Desulfovibrio sp. OttesenSCG-928-C14]|nr:glycine cleavage system protein GcvH [Desulfovibrio sp. OttesenSCG-928-C14]
MNIPADLKYVDTHEWVRIEGGVAVIGITDFAQEQLGDVTFVELPAVGDNLEFGKEMGSVESVKAASDLYSPVSGEVLEVNAALENNPEIINTAPYTDGWMLKVKLSGPADGLISAAEYQKLISA